MASKEILIIVDSIDINAGSGPKANLGIIRNLISAGNKVTILHYSFKDIQISGAKTILIKEHKLSLFFILGRVIRILARFTGLNLNHYLENKIGFSFIFINDSNSIKSAIKRLNPDTFNLIFTLSQGASFRPHHALIPLHNFHKKWLAYIHDPYPFHFYPRPYNWVQHGYRFKEKLMLTISEKAGHSGFPSELLKEWMGSYFPNFIKTGIIIPHQLDQETIDASKEVKSKNNKFIFLHAGSMLKQRDPKGLLDSYNEFLRKNPDAVDRCELHLIGPAEYHAQFINEYSVKTPSIKFENRNVPFKEILSIQMNCNVNIILESKSEISPFLPGKFPHCVAANKPILLLGPYYSESKRLLGNDYPYWSEQDNIENISNLMSVLYNNFKSGKDELLNRPDLIEYLSFNALQKQIEKL